MIPYGLPWWLSSEEFCAIQEIQETWVHSLGWEDPLQDSTAPTPTLSPGESRGQRSLVGYRPQGFTVAPEQDTTRATEHTCARDTLERLFFVLRLKNLGRVNRQ